MAIVAPKIKYLTNKDLLEAIHVSKSSYCSFVDPAHARYDFIVGINNKDGITLELIEEARKKRLSNLHSQDKKAQVAKGIKDPKPSSLTIDDIPIESIVIRVMTFDHIPINPDKIDKAKTLTDKHLRVNFPPFQHFIMKDGELVCVLKSHWRDGLENGYFCKDHGKMTNNLAAMFIKLVERYGHKGNWRGYCVDQETEALTQRGWLNIDEINEDDMIVSYDNNNLKWSSIKSIYRGEYNGKMHKMTVRGLDSLVTPEHKFVTQRGLVKAEYLLETDKLILMGNRIESTNQTYNDSMVELIGWILTEGCYEYTSDKSLLKRIQIWQNDNPKGDRIRKCLNDLNIKFSESKNKFNNICFSISRSHSRELLNIIPEKNLSMKFILSLTSDQRELLINTMIDGDGWRTGDNKQHRRYVQKDKIHIDLFQALCAISGHRTNIHLRDHISFGKSTQSYNLNIFSSRKNTTRIECVDFHGGKNTEKTGLRGKINHPNKPTENYQGMVWCPETEYGCFLARRNGTVYLTGNTYVDEMKSQALLQLSQVGLQFDESRSDTPNPFAYYTQTITNSFMRILNIEKKNQTIRDDMLIMHGVAPSNTRQVENEIAQRTEKTL